MADVTVILLNYKRPDNIPVLVDALRSQTEPIDIWLVNNAGPYTWMPTFAADRYTWMPWNGGCFSRLLMAAYVQTPWICFISDDLCPADDRFIADMLLVVRGQFNRGRAMVGTDGHGLNRESPYYDKYDNRDGLVPILKGTVICFPRAALDRVHLSRPLLRLEPAYLRRCEDLYLSLETGAGKPVHWSDAGLRARLKDLPGEEVGLCKEPGHYRIREQFCEQYVREILID